MATCIDKGEPSNLVSCKAKGGEMCPMKTDRDDERARIRAKLSEQDREFFDTFKLLFPNGRLVAIRFKDGEHIGGKL